jgi:hypothetical protein
LPAFAPSFAGFFRRKFVSGPFSVRSFSAFARYLTLFGRIHRSKTAPTLWSLRLSLLFLSCVQIADLRFLGTWILSV